MGTVLKKSICYSPMFFLKTAGATSSHESIPRNWIPWNACRDFSRGRKCHSWRRWVRPAPVGNPGNYHLCTTLTVKIWAHCNRSLWLLKSVQCPHQRCSFLAIPMSITQKWATRTVSIIHRELCTDFRVLFMYFTNLNIQADLRMHLASWLLTGLGYHEVTCP